MGVRLCGKAATLRCGLGDESRGLWWRHTTREGDCPSQHYTDHPRAVPAGCGRGGPSVDLVCGCMGAWVGQWVGGRVRRWAGA